MFVATLQSGLRCVGERLGCYGSRAVKVAFLPAHYVSEELEKSQNSRGWGQYLKANLLMRVWLVAQSGFSGLYILVAGIPTTALVSTNFLQNFAKEEDLNSIVSGLSAHILAVPLGVIGALMPTNGISMLKRALVLSGSCGRLFA